MIRLSANLSTMFTEFSFLDRFEQAAISGFKGVEFWFPYQWGMNEIAEKLNQHSLEVVLYNSPPGDWEAGDRGVACIPGREDEFRESMDLGIKYARALRCRNLHCLAGIAPEEFPEEIVRRTLVENLRFAAEATKKEGIRLLVEALNSNRFPGFYLTHTWQAVELINEVGSDNLRILYDVFHMQIMEGNLTDTIRNNLPYIGHIQIADNPGRHEPGSGEINFENLLRFIDEAGYGGWIGCEYIPLGATKDGIRWAEPYLTKRR
jgi:hydroxypyruvate isomerase